MTKRSGVDRLGLVRLTAGQVFGRARRMCGRLARPLFFTLAKSPARLLIAPPDIRTADPTIADDIYAGYFSFAGKAVNTHGRAPFDVIAPSPEWAAALAGFGWLRHLRAAETALASVNARALVGDWIAAAARADNKADWRADVVARRLLSWLSQSRMILEDADRPYYMAFLKALGRDAAFLRYQLFLGLPGDLRLSALISLSMFSLCADVPGGLQNRMSRLLGGELTRQILPDGGHIGRNPGTLVELLLELLPLRQAYVARGIAAPEQLLNSIDRMLPHLRMLRLGDGSLALFNGMGATSQYQLANALAHGDAGAAATQDAPYSGYQRLEAGDLTLTMDTGRPPPPASSRQAHAGCLSFEVSSGGHRLVVNCGAPSDSRGDLREAARATAAHSTLTIEDTSSCAIASGQGISSCVDGWIIGGPETVRAARLADDAWIGVEASHDGYMARFGVSHRRVARLSRDGGFIQGEDLLEPFGAALPPEAAFAIRFHLHPAALATAADDGRSVVIGLPNGDSWLFHAGGLQVSIEESVYFAVIDRARPTWQIVVNGIFPENQATTWSFERLNGWREDEDA